MRIQGEKFREQRELFVSEIENLTNGRVDRRQKELDKVLKLGVAVLVEYYGDDPSQIAARLSVCVKVANAEAIEKMIACDSDADLRSCLMRFERKPLATEDGKAEQFLVGLLETVEGRTLYCFIAVMLAWGLKQANLRDKIGKPVGGVTDTRQLAEAPADQRIVALAKAEGVHVALARLREDRSGGTLALNRAAATLEHVLGEVPDAQALTLFEREIPLDERIALIGVRGDLDSVTALVANWYEVFAGMFQHLLIASVQETIMVRGGMGSTSRLYYGQELLAWVLKVQSHRDFQLMLKKRLCRHTFQEMIALAIFEVCCVDGDEVSTAQIEDSVFIQYGIEAGWARAYLVAAMTARARPDRELRKIGVDEAHSASSRVSLLSTNDIKQSLESAMRFTRRRMSEDEDGATSGQDTGSISI